MKQDNINKFLTDVSNIELAFFSGNIEEKLQQFRKDFGYLENNEAVRSIPKYKEALQALDRKDYTNKDVISYIGHFTPDFLKTLPDPTNQGHKKHGKAA